VAVLTAVDGLEQVVGVLLQQSGVHTPAADHGQREVVVDIVVWELSIQALDEVLPSCLQLVLLPVQLHCQTCEDGEDVKLLVVAHFHSVGSYSPALERGLLRELETADCAWEYQGYLACFPGHFPVAEPICVGVACFSC
jgi:hypothetical protein